MNAARVSQGGLSGESKYNRTRFERFLGKFCIADRWLVWPGLGIGLSLRCIELRATCGCLLRPQDAGHSLP